MTPSAKAKQLIDQFYPHVQWKMGQEDTKQRAVECALICVRQIIENYEFDSLYIDDKRIMGNINYWDEVEREIQSI